MVKQFTFFNKNNNILVFSNNNSLKKIVLLNKVPFSQIMQLLNPSKPNDSSKNYTFGKDCRKYYSISNT